MERETLLLWLVLLVYVTAGGTAIFGVVFKRKPYRVVLGLIAAGVVLHTLAIGLRWERIGHGPFVTMFEILSSNIWSLMLVFLIASWRIPAIRPSSAVVMPVLFMMMGWLLLTNPGEGALPPTYDTIWLYIHIGMGKVFLGAVLVALALAGVILLRGFGLGQRFSSMPDSASLDELAYRCMAIGLIFDTLMLVSGAIWAQDAWGRYWNWDPIETWAFLTWLLLGSAIHFRLTLKPAPVVSSTMVVVVFVMGFLCFFGVPFLSQAPHKGMV